MKYEALHQVTFNKYLRETNFRGFFELKQTGTDYFSFKNFEKHQLQSLLALKVNGLVWKLSDADPRQKPCDCISIPPMFSYVVIKYPLAFVVIEIRDFIDYKDSTDRKTLSYEQALTIATKIIRI